MGRLDINMNTWQALRNWKFYLEFVTGMSLLLTAAFFVSAINKSQTIMENQRQADAVIFQMEQAESQLSQIAEPSTTVNGTYYLENLSNTYLGPIAALRPGLNKNQERLNTLMVDAEALSESKTELLAGMATIENFILNLKSGEEAQMNSADVAYLATVSAWLTNLKSALYTGNLDASSLNRLNQLTGTLQSEAESVSGFFPAQIITALSFYMAETQSFLDARLQYQTAYSNSLASHIGLKEAMVAASTEWARSAHKNQLVLWLACMMGMALTAGLFWKLFSNKHFSTMLAGTPEEAKLIENSEFIHHVDELLNIVDQNWIDSRRESSILNETAQVNEDVKRNIHQLEHDIKTRNAHEEDEFESLISLVKKMRTRAQDQQLGAQDIVELEEAIKEMHQSLLMDNKSVSDDLSGVENSLYALNTDMRKLQHMMGKVVQDSRKLLRMRNSIEESEEIARSI